MGYMPFTLSTIRSKLNAGEYASAAAANRAIGKAKGLSAEDGKKAKALVAKHFGAEVVAAVTKPAKKVKKAKKVAKKVAKAAKKSVSSDTPKRKGRPPGSKNKASKKVAKPAVEAKEPKRRVQKTLVHESQMGSSAADAKLGSDYAAVERPARPLSSRSIADDPERVITMMGKVVTTIDAALKSTETAKRLFPKGSFDDSVAAAQLSMGRAVRVLDSAVISRMLPEDTSLKSKLNGGSAKSGLKKGKRVKVADHESVDDLNGDLPLSEEDQALLEIASESGIVED